MITRDEIRLELSGYQGKNKDEKRVLMREFLKDIGEPEQSIEKILDDLESYDEY